MIYYYLTAPSGDMVASTFDEYPAALQLINRTEPSGELNGLRFIYRDYAEGSVRIVATGDDRKLISTTRHASKTAEAYSQLIPLFSKLEETYKHKYAVVSHNIVTTHSRLQDLVAALVSEQDLTVTDTHAEQVKIVEDKIDKNKREAADTVLAIAKRVVDLEAQLDGLNIFTGDFDQEFGYHNMFRLMRNIIFPYYGELAQRGIKIKWFGDTESLESHRLKTSYKALNVAMHHFFNNIFKYAKEGSTVGISYDIPTKILTFKMRSRKIDYDELKRVFDMGYSGRSATEMDEAGDGIGMHMVKLALETIGARMEIFPHYETEEPSGDGPPYVKNDFIVCF